MRALQRVLWVLKQTEAFEMMTVEELELFMQKTFPGGEPLKEAMPWSLWLLIFNTDVKLIDKPNGHNAIARNTSTHWSLTSSTEKSENCLTFLLV